MTDASGVEVEGADRLASTLHDAAEDIGSLEDAKSDSGRMVQLRAQSLSPVDTGALRSSIQADTQGAEVLVSSSVEYALVQEYGSSIMAAHPFMRPALADSTSQILDLFQRDAQKALDSVKGA